MARALTMKKALLCMLLLPSLAAAQERVADVEATQGEVKLNPSRDPKVSLVPTQGEDVFFNDVVTTFTKAKARLRFIDESIISLGENTRLRVTKLVFDPDKNRDAEFDLQTGLALFMVGKAIFGSYFQVLTPFGTFRAKGTVFSVEVFADRARLSVLEGVVEYIDGSGAIVSVSAGQTLEVNSAKSAPPAPAPLPAGEEGKILTAVTATVTPLLPAVTQLSLVEKTLSLPLTAPVGELLKAPLLKPATNTLATTTNLVQQTILQPTLGLNLGLSSFLSVDNTANLTRVVGSVVLIP